MSEKQETLPTILVIEQDDEIRPIWMHNLCNNGYRVIMVLNEEDAIERMRDGRERPDLILINQVKLPIDEFINMGRRIRESARLASRTPIVVIVEQYGVDMEGKDIKVGESEYATYLEDGQQLMNLLHRLCSNR